MTSPPDETVHVEVRGGAYADSVALLQVSKDVAGTPGVLAAQVAMATRLNLDLLAEMGFDLPATTPNDMVVALRVESRDVVPSAVAAVDAALAATARGRSESAETAAPPRTTGAAISRDDAGRALISVPGASAAVEAMDALDAGRDVMIFSDNVPVSQEIALKQIAAERDLLVMGPDCGTAVVDGVGLGFANAVRPGPVGIVAASGTGCQQLMCLLDAAGVGVAHALGVGGRDLSADVGGLSARQAIRRLDADPEVELIVVVSKPPADSVAADLRAFATDLQTPVQFALLGAGQPDITAATESVLDTLGRERPTWPHRGTPQTSENASGYLRGLFVGGTMCDEAMLIAADALGPIRSNIPLEPAYALDDTMTASAHLMIDFGDDSMTAGRAHPMIDPTLRLDYLSRTANDPETGVLLLDVVLGHGAEADPAAPLAPEITKLTNVPVVVACVGTDDDPQGLTQQAETLAAAGAEVYLSNAQAARRAIELIGGAK